jgi:hypothetical protein
MGRSRFGRLVRCPTDMMASVRFPMDVQPPLASVSLSPLRTRRRLTTAGPPDFVSDQLTNGRRVCILTVARLQRLAQPFSVRMDETLRVRLHLPSSPGSGAALCQGLLFPPPTRSMYFDPMVQNRIALRFCVSKAATIEFIGGRSINCVIRNLSIAGAAIPLSKSSSAALCDKEGRALLAGAFGAVANLARWLHHYLL